jgi:hypothetical protein
MFMFIKYFKILNTRKVNGHQSSNNYYSKLCSENDDVARKQSIAQEKTQNQQGSIAGYNHS